MDVYNLWSHLLFVYPGTGSSVLLILGGVLGGLLLMVVMVVVMVVFTVCVSKRAKKAKLATEGEEEIARCSWPQPSNCYEY